MTVSIPELLAFHADKNTPDHHGVTVNLSELKQLVAENHRMHQAVLDYLKDYAERMRAAGALIVNPGDPDPPAAEDYPVPAPGLAGFPPPPDRIVFDAPPLLPPAGASLGRILAAVLPIPLFQLLTYFLYRDGTKRRAAILDAAKAAHHATICPDCRNHGAHGSGVLSP